MSDALRRLLAGVIDYAGLFPPAQLSMEESVENYLRYRQGGEGWIMDRFVCSSARLAELAPLVKGVEEPLSLTVVGQASTDPESWGNALVHDAQAMTRFMEMAGDGADIEAYEVRVPDTGHLDEYLGDLRSFSQVEVYCELPWGEGLADALGAIADTEWLGAKARTGGLEAKAFPSSDDLAVFLQQCFQLEISFKLTAGLHHPFRRFEESVGRKMHGFLNVLTASALLASHDLSRAEIVQILECEDAGAFRFSDGMLTYDGMEASMEDIEDARSLFVGFGSCSIDEPLDDLTHAGLISR